MGISNRKYGDAVLQEFHLKIAFLLTMAFQSKCALFSHSAMRVCRRCISIVLCCAALMCRFQMQKPQNTHSNFVGHDTSLLTTKIRLCDWIDVLLLVLPFPMVVCNAPASTSTPKCVPHCRYSCKFLHWKCEFQSWSKHICHTYRFVI